MIPMRFIFRSRWAALAWAAGICLTAAQFAGGDAAGGAVDAPGGTDGNATAALMSDLQ
ncbi:MAG TPA: hypothetical protein VNT42_05680 [Sphingomonas sp.]|nr:hypothetical protein [Sphingomonas sp.]